MVVVVAIPGTCVSCLFRGRSWKSWFLDSNPGFRASDPYLANDLLSADGDIQNIRCRSHKPLID